MRLPSGSISGVLAKGRGWVMLRCCDGVLLDQHVLHLLEIMRGRLAVIWNNAAMSIFGWKIVSVHIHMLQLAAKSTCLCLVLAAGIDRKEIIYIYQFVLCMMM